MMSMYFFILYVNIFTGVSFVTLLERKVLGLMQFRLGPNKILFKGFFQSLGDALKLMSKSSFNSVSDVLMYNFMPIGMMVVSMSMWSSVSSNMCLYNYDFIYLLCIMSVGVYPIMYGSWFSDSLYSMLGALRSVAQVISYEVSFIIITMSLVLYSGEFGLEEVSYMGGSMGFIFFYFIMIMLFSSILAELNRAPVDLIEGESELVSGFNLEYSGMKFALIFLAEYSMILFMSGLFVFMVMGLGVGLVWSLMTVFITIIIIWIRSVLPRLRYDNLMYLCWVSMLTLALGEYTINLSMFGVINLMI